MSGGKNARVVTGRISAGSEVERERARIGATPLRNGTLPSSACGTFSPLRREKENGGPAGFRDSHCNLAGGIVAIHSGYAF